MRYKLCVLFSRPGSRRSQTIVIPQLPLTWAQATRQAERLRRDRGVIRVDIIREDRLVEEDPA